MSRFSQGYKYKVAIDTGSRCKRIDQSEAWQFILNLTILKECGKFIKTGLYLQIILKLNRHLSREVEGLSPMKPDNRPKGSGANSCRIYHPER